ncbi:MAG TPA: GNAT family N-acetyltransferase [Microvirga sp.]|jgi:GNAT superfamily N-acetyltransferase|nr:GNAT family N-acetyltransferase [Microvirga sp.]
MEIRIARTEDAQQASTVLRRSIQELCQADHNGDAAKLADWLSNKTPETVAAWISHPQNLVLVATDGAAILGVAAMTKTGEILLNYVSPDARFQGVSKALISRLEAQARELGLDRCTLNSTKTARKFYQSLGYQEEIAPANSSCRSMAKTLI